MIEPLPRGRNPFDNTTQRAVPRNPGGKILKAQLRDQTSRGKGLRR